MQNGILQLLLKMKDKILKKKWSEIIFDKYSASKKRYFL